MQQGSTEAAKEIIAREIVDLIIADMKVWPAVQFLNFYLIPLNFQVAFNSTIAVAWNIYFSYKTCAKEECSIESGEPHEHVIKQNMTSESLK